MRSGLVEKYSGMHVAVIGGAGFVGSYLVRRLLEAGAHVTVVDDFSRGNNILSDAAYIDLDVGKEIANLTTVLAGKDAVFNLAAAVAGVLYNESHQNEMYYTNMLVLTGPVLAAQAAGVPAFMQTSSVCVYAPAHNAPSQEPFGLMDEPHPANAGYAEAKRDGERFATWSSIPRVVIVRPSNVAGAGDYFDEKAHVIPAFVKRAHSLPSVNTVYEKFLVYGNPDATREFIHPDDVALGMMTALAFGIDREAYNIGCNGQNTISMRNLAVLVLELNDKYLVELEVDDSVGGGDDRRFSDSTKLNNLGWRHDAPLGAMVRETVTDWQLRNRK